MNEKPDRPTLLLDADTVRAISEVAESVRNSPALNALNSPEIKAFVEVQQKSASIISAAFGEYQKRRNPILETIGVDLSNINIGFGTLAVSIASQLSPNIKWPDLTSGTKPALDELASNLQSLRMVGDSSIKITLPAIGLENFADLFNRVRRQQEEILGPQSAWGRIQKQLEEQRLQWSNWTKIGMSGALAASLAAGPNHGANALTDYALVVAEQLRQTHDEELWKDAATESLLVEGLASFSIEGANDERRVDEVVGALERHSERIIASIGKAALPSQRLGLLQYATFFLTLVQTVFAVLAYYQPNNSQGDETSRFSAEVIARIDSNIASLEYAVRQSASLLPKMRYVVSKVKTRARVRQEPTTRSKIVGFMSSGQNAVFVSESDRWVEVEFVDPLTETIVHGWVYGGLLEKYTLVMESPAAAGSTAR